MGGGEGGEGDQNTSYEILEDLIKYFIKMKRSKKKSGSAGEGAYTRLAAELHPRSPWKARTEISLDLHGCAVVCANIY